MISRFSLKQLKIYSGTAIKIILFLLPVFLMSFVIGIHSDYLINNVLKYIFLSLSIASFILLITCIIIYVYSYKSGKIYKHKVRRIIIDILLGITGVGVGTLLFLLYGWSNDFRDWLISTSLQTMHHQYICKIFYSEGELTESLARNYIIETGEDTNPDLIDTTKGIVYKNEYEREILEKDSEDQLYKIIRFQVNGQNAYLAAVYDPSRISVGYSKWLFKSGQYVTQMAEEANAPLAINGGGFIDVNYNSNGSTPKGFTMSNGKIINMSEDGSVAKDVIGFTEDNVLVLIKSKSVEEIKQMKLRDAVSMGPFLITNGKSAFIKGNGGWGYAARTAIGQREDGIVLLLVVDSNATRTKGASMVDLTEIMERYGAINAANLDGGTSSVMVENYKIINDPIDSTLAHKTRPIATCWLVK